VTSRATGRPTFFFGYPILDERGEVSGIVSVGFDLKFTRLFESARLPPGSSFSLVDRNGVVVARNVDSERYVGHSIPASLLARMVQGPEEATRVGPSYTDEVRVRVGLAPARRGRPRSEGGGARPRRRAGPARAQLRPDGGAARPARDGAPGERAKPPASPEDGDRGAPRGRRRARLQQPADGDPEQLGAPRAGAPRGRCGRGGPHPRRGPALRAPREAAPGVRAQGAVAPRPGEHPPDGRRGGGAPLAQRRQAHRAPHEPRGRAATGEGRSRPAPHRAPEPRPQRARRHPGRRSSSTW
jgi:hypothetical protein